ncbi:MAG: VWA domain-containing protein, partial [Thermoguttaceae bacterium]|nr:VWA domain-containing protein [Thermoguttaceae bacterium]
MNWTSPGILTALWILPVFALLLWRQRKRQKRREELFLQSPMTGRLFPEATARRAFWRGALLLASLALLITALAGPRFGVYFEKVTRRGADILILLDTSRSMLAEDLAPNRLEAAKLDIEDLLSAVSGDRVGLIAFAGKPVIKVPLTSDFGFFRETLKGLDIHAPPMGGTAIGDAVRLALRAMAPDAARDQAILL